VALSFHDTTTKSRDAETNVTELCPFPDTVLLWWGMQRMNSWTKIWIHNVFAYLEFAAYSCDSYSKVQCFHPHPHSLHLLASVVWTFHLGEWWEVKFWSLSGRFKLSEKRRYHKISLNRFLDMAAVTTSLCRSAFKLQYVSRLGNVQYPYTIITAKNL